VWHKVKAVVRLLRGYGLLPGTREIRELRRLYSLGEKVRTSSDLLGFPMEVNDARMFAAMYEQTFRNGEQAFQCGSASPRIIDCGANVGVTVHYWKRLFPGARITAFEPDPTIFELLKHNCAKLSQVELMNCAVWTRAEKLTFASNHSTGGYLAQLSERGECIESFTVNAVRLRDYLEERVDLLKMDIEGAEKDVICDCADMLENVNKLLVEYHSFIDRPQQIGRFFGVLESAGFRLHVHSVLAARRPFLDRPVINGKDLRLQIFAARLEARQESLGHAAWSPSNFGY